MSQGEIIANLTFVGEVHMHHPRMPYGSEGVFLVAYPDYLVLRGRYNKKELLVIPWNNITQIRTGIVEKGFISSMGAMVSSMLGIGQVTSLGDPYHTGIKITFKDVDYLSEFMVFFKTGSEWNGERIIKQLDEYFYNFKWRMGSAGRPR